VCDKDRASVRGCVTVWGADGGAWYCLFSYNMRMCSSLRIHTYIGTELGWRDDLFRRDSPKITRVAPTIRGDDDVNLRPIDIIFGMRRRRRRRWQRFREDEYYSCAALQPSAKSLLPQVIGRDKRENRHTPATVVGNLLFVKSGPTDRPTVVVVNLCHTSLLVGIVVFISLSPEIIILYYTYEYRETTRSHIEHIRAHERKYTIIVV